MQTEPAPLPFDKKFSKYDQENAVGLAVMVIRNGRTEFRKGYGLANLKTGAKVDHNTNFRMASVSKQFTAMCIAILEERKYLSADDFISQHFPDLPDYMKSIKVSHLVHHLSGLPEYEHELCHSDKSQPLLSNQDVYNFYKKQSELKFLPGHAHEYSNGGYCMLALLVEKASTQSFPDFVTENIFKPASMKNSAIIQYPSNVKNQAISYSAWPFFEDIDFNTGNALYGDDGVYTSLTDMESWIHALENNTLISPATTQKIFSPTQDNNGRVVPYGYGWGIADIYGRKIIAHNGSWVGFSTIVANVPEQKLWFVAFSNSRAIEAGAAFEDMVKHYLPKKK